MPSTIAPNWFRAAAAGLAGALIVGGCNSAQSAANTALNATAQTATTAIHTEHAAVDAANDVANNAVQIVQAAATHVGQIPQIVYDMAAQVVTANHASWGSPQQIIVTDSSYVLLYPTPPGERLRTGLPRMVVIQRNDRTDPNQRL